MSWNGMVLNNEELLDGAPAGLRLVAKTVEHRLGVLFETESARWQEIDPELKVPFDALFRMIDSGGKRLRPAFCRFAFEGSGGDKDSLAIIDAMAALELLHTFALIHDDIMDGSHTRRGHPTVHSSFISNHYKQLFKGESRRYGEGVAILIGDLAFVYADSLLEGAPIKTRHIFSELRIEVNIGQYLDMLGTARGNPSLELARKVCVYKSGKYTVERPMHIGASLAGASEEQLDELSKFGLPLGEAFQLKDDILGTFGDSIKTGKPVGEDLIEGKPTALVAYTIERANIADRQKFVELFTSQNPKDDDLDVMLEIIQGCGAREFVEQRIGVLVEKAIDDLGTSYLDDDSKSNLSELFSYVGSRSR